MPFVRRSAEGSIVALLDRAGADAAEELPASHPEVRAFLGLQAEATHTERGFSDLDADFIRVMEDLIDVLIEKGVLRLTDLPPQAQRKLLARKDKRRRLQGALNLLGGGDVI
ncbi:hypothetical protein [Uliginosibacterium sp. H1]|uniref:hypothetical protein n=1 Tax=Uliginosibacterium sp. H1 TaxID=3114757 RepID=UPI002E18702A|nr:hypothetical protein [Uliginosibacterium sp. H1]